VAGINRTKEMEQNNTGRCSNVQEQVRCKELELVIVPTLEKKGDVAFSDEDHPAQIRVTKLYIEDVQQ
jgi:hypothetical protein